LSGAEVTNKGNSGSSHEELKKNIKNESNKKNRKCIITNISNNLKYL